MKLLSSFVVLLAALGLALGVSAKTKNMMQEHEVIEFSPGQSAISTADQEKLQKVLREARAKGRITQVEVAVWSDKSLPQQGSLAVADQQLAEQREKEIKQAIKKDLGSASFVKTYNMAEGAHWLGKMFHADDAQLKSEFAKATSSGIEREDFQYIKDQGAPSKAVVVIKVRKKSIAERRKELM